MGEKERKPFQLTFNGLLKVDFHGSRVTSDGGLILVRELDERLGLGTLIDEHLSDSREGLNKKFPLADLLRQSVYSRLAGYEDLNDAARVSADPTFRLIGSEKNWNRGAALTSTLHGFETGTLTSEDNLLGLMALNRELVGRAEAGDDSERVVLDMDSTSCPQFLCFLQITGLFSHAPQTAHSEIGDCPASIKETRGGRAPPSHDLDINTPRMNSMLATSRASSPGY